MGKHDIAQMKFLRDTRHFADIWNGLAFNGKQVIRWDELTEINPVGLADFKGKHSKKTADMVMARTKNGELLSVLIAENQTTIDYSMIVRVHLREAMEYDKQFSDIVKRNKGKRKSSDDITSDGEYLYSFRKTDRLRPVSTLILYWNSDNWDGATRLHELIDFAGAEEMKAFVSDFKLNLVNISDVKNEDEVFKNPEVKDVIALFLRRNDKIRFKEYVDTYGKRINSESIELVSEMVASNELRNYIENVTEPERSDNKMCKAITELIQDGRDKGRAEGKLEGRLEGRLEGIELTNQLYLKLISENRIEDIKRAATDAAFRKGLILEFFPDKAKDFG